MTQHLVANGLNPFAIDGPSQAVFVWDQLGFSDSYDIRVDQSLLGLDIPGLSAGFNLHLSGSMALVFTFSFDLGSLSLDYNLSDATFADQTDKGSVPVPPEVNGDAWTGLYYRNHTIELATQSAAYASGAIHVVPADLSKEFLDVSLNYAFGATASNFGVQVDLPFIPTFGYSNDTTVDLINLGTGGEHSSPYAGSKNLYHLAYGGALFNQDSGPITGFINVPTPPEYNTPSGTADTANPNLPALVLNDDADLNFAQISVDLAQEITDNLGIPLAIDQDFGPLHLSLALINLVATLGLKIGQEITFTPQAVLVTMTEMATGQSVSGELGKPLYLDLPQGFGVSDVQVSYQLFGDLESVTGIKLDGSLDLGLLSGSLSNTLGIDFSLGFGPLVTANWAFESSLLPLLTLHEAVSTNTTTQTYHVYTERTPDQGGEGNDLITLTPNDASTPFHGNYGADTLVGSTLNNDLWGDAGNDSLVGSDGNDTLTGGTGADTLMGGEGNDRLYQYAWDLVPDVMDGGNGTDLAGVDLSGMVTSFNLDFRDAAGTMTLPDGTVLTSIEKVEFVAGFGSDSLHGTGNGDLLAGGYGNDTLDGAAPGSQLYGDGGNDLLIAHVGGDTADDVYGGAGIDTLELHIASGVAPAALDVTAYRNNAIEPGTFDYVNTTQIGIFFRNDIEKLHYIRDGGDADTTGDTVTGGAMADTIETGGGNDSIDGGGGLDSILAGAGDDTVRSTGADALLDGGDGIDTLYLSRLGPARVGVSVSLNAVGDTRLADGTIVRNFEKLGFLGTEAGDTVNGGAYGDTLGGFGGNDSLNGGGGSDQIVGGTGDDTVAATYGGADTLDGGDGKDLLKLDASTDTGGVRLTLANQATGGDTLVDGTVYSNFERLTFTGGSGGDTITGGDGEVQQYRTSYVYLGGKYVPLTTPAGSLGDIINGGAGDDVINGGGGRDIISGGAGNDTIILSAGGDQIDGGQEADNSPGHDTLVVNYTGSAPVFTSRTETLNDGNGHTSTRLVLSLADGTTVRGIESIVYNNTDVNAAAETVPGSPLDDQMVGTPGSDSLDGSGGNDTLFGNGGHDTLRGGQGDDQIQGFGSGSNIDGGDGTDTLMLSLADFNVPGGQAPITGNLKDPVGGATLSDGTVIKGIESYSLTLGTGNDTVTLGYGRDSVQGGGGDDTAIIDRSDSLAPVVVQIGFPSFGGGGFGGPTYGNMLVFQDGMMLTFFNHYTILGGTADDRISLVQGPAFGTVANGNLSGGAGNDTLLGGAGNDTLEGGSGNDSLDGGAGTNLAIFHYAAAQVAFANHADGSWTAVTPDGTDTLVNIQQIQFTDTTAKLALHTPRDFGATGASDVLWLSDSGTEYQWHLGAGGTIASQGGNIAGAGWNILGSGDFFGDGHAAVLWRHTDGTTWMWQMNGSAIQAGSGPVGKVDGDWSVLGIGDLTGDGKADIVWRHAGDNALWLFAMNGTTIDPAHSGAITYVGAPWVPVAVGALDGIGHESILFQNSTNGEFYAWTMNGTAIAAQKSLGMETADGGSTDWSVAGLADFNADGRDDILLRSTSTGDLRLWEMNGDGPRRDLAIDNPGKAWSITTLGDYDGNGDADILWRNSSTGEVYLWTMNGNAIVSTQSYGNPGAEWHIAA
jgi:Ca2+-binding RTX toxin-like protein